MDLIRLSKLKPHWACRVESVEECPIKRRLEGLGVTSGAVLVKLFTAPLGDPSAYLVRGTIAAIRRADAERITVRGCSGGTYEKA